MVLETAQLLSNALHHNIGQGPYKISHMNHPCSVWVRQSNGNYMWTIKLFKALCAEYTRRYHRTHKSELLMPIFESISDKNEVPTEFANCTNFKDLPVFAAYRAAMKTKWANDKTKPSWRVK
jgi:hypothetical protein